MILGIDANTKVSSFEDGWLVGPCTTPAKLTSKEQERASSFTDFFFFLKKKNARWSYSERVESRGNGW